MNALFGFAGTGFTGGHRLGAGAVEGMLKFQGNNPQGCWIKFIEDMLGIVGAVVVPHTRVIATNNEMGTAVVLTDEGMENRFPWLCIAHRCRINGQNHPIFGEVVLEHDFIAAHPHIGGNVILLGGTYEGMQKETIDDFKGTFLDIFVGAVDRIAGLEPHNGAPTFFTEEGTGIHRINAVVGKLGMGMPL